ncbi:transcriptional regulator family: Fungal Specific TF [Penicillium roqueforti]|nr:transcriptional regulator family: Fungal Specific TF [Penicillium roqueforti]KAI2690491.1 transcriptional regulator family: Fungal Specific TF [Penicillium roqueforti]KAI2702200.1 transcriptional regulator family: Fungal Specific TF [Penicillium roqueforti]KAI2721717.1 transcriptional regulator family: Fungal Specific TF [Penicillium roqueforti]KAI2728807.1 transcriptional regulator family: Fungal Specific TF [Penicillium roqueforti]
MLPLMKGKLMLFDEVAWDKSDEQLATWEAILLNQETMQKITTLIKIHRQGITDQLFPPQKGSFNVVIRLRFLDGASAIIRFPIPGYSVFPDEKLHREVRVMRFLERHTDIRIPHILHHGTSDESPHGLGPFIIMEYIDHNADLVDALNTPGILDEERPVLDPNIGDNRLRSVYNQMAGLLLQVAKYSFPRIGCISNAAEDEFEDEWVVAHRPLSINMNELVQVGGVRAGDLPGMTETFATAAEYLLALAELHMTHLSSQRNDAIDDAEDCRTKYIARCLFRKLAREGRLSWAGEEGMFKLFCDDLRPANVLANSDFGYKISGAIDWEFAYAAPLEFVYSPPCWLLLERPEYWDNGLDDWEWVYESRLEIFLQELHMREDVDIRRGVMNQGSHPSEFDMLVFMGGITSELEQKHLDLAAGPAMTLTASPASQSLRGTLTPDRRILTPNTSSSGSASDMPTSRGSLSDAGGISYEDQLLQHFLTIGPPAALFAPVNIEWKYMRPALLVHARDSSPLLNALYCYADVHKAMMEGKKWHFAPTFYRVASSEIQACIHGEVTESTLIKVFGAVFLLMISELLSPYGICTGTSYIHSGYLILQRFHDRTRHWTGLGHLLVSWILLLDVKSLIAGRDGDPLPELGNIPEHSITQPPDTQTSQTSHITAPTANFKQEDIIEDPFLSPNYLVYEAIVGPAFRFFVQAQQVVRRIVCIDLHHRSRGTLTDEFEVLQLAHKIGADLETLWHRRPSVIDVYGRPEALTDILCAPVASEICRTFRQYVANFLANFIYLHRVAFAIYPRTERVNGAVDQIIQLATVDSAGPDHLPVSFLWPLFIAGLEATEDQRKWIGHEIQRMAAAHEADAAPSATRHPTADRVLVLVEEMTRRQDVSRTWADSKCVRREMFSDFFVVI